jgi:hypothetical protein
MSEIPVRPETAPRHVEADASHAAFANVTVDIRHVRALARRRAALALATLPLLIAIGSTAVVLAPSLALIAVLCAFFAWACASIAVRQRRAAAAASVLVLEVDHGRLHVMTQPAPPRRIVRAIDRPGYLRLLTTQQRVAAFWFDARRDPTAFVDVPLPRDARARLLGALHAAGVPVRREGSAARVLALIGALALGLAGLTVARVGLGLSMVAIAASPATWSAGSVAMGLVAWTWWRLRAARPERVPTATLRSRSARSDRAGPGDGPASIVG